MTKPVSPDQPSDDLAKEPRSAAESLRENAAPIASMLDKMQCYRVLDANANRAAEGLRTLEEIARFVWNDIRLAEEYKHVRHRLTELTKHWDIPQRYAARDTAGDVGTAISTPSEQNRSSIAAIAAAASGRCEQSIRCIEEFSKLTHPQSSENWQALRYHIYDLNRQVIRRLNPCNDLVNAKLYILTDCQKPIDEFVRYIQTLAASGADLIQIRDKRLDDCQLLDYAKKAVDAVTQMSCHIIINDRPDIALLSGAAGVHLGQEDLPAKQVRILAGPRLIIGVSTHNIDQAKQAVTDGADYIGCGPTFPSQTKSFEQFAGVDFLRDIAAQIAIPSFAIGGIHQGNLAQVMSSGVQRIAVSGVVNQASSPGQAAQELKQMLQGN